MIEEIIDDKKQHGVFLTRKFYVFKNVFGCSKESNRKMLKLSQIVSFMFSGRFEKSEIMKSKLHLVGEKLCLIRNVFSC